MENIKKYPKTQWMLYIQWNDIRLRLGDISRDGSHCFLREPLASWLKAGSLIAVSLNKRELVRFSLGKQYY